jgi:hypothetical protein
MASVMLISGVNSGKGTIVAFGESNGNPDSDFKATLELIISDVIPKISKGIKYKVIPESANNKDIENILFISEDGKSICHVHGHIIDVERAIKDMTTQRRTSSDYMSELEELLGGLNTLNKLVQVELQKPVKKWIL